MCEDQNTNNIYYFEFIFILTGQLLNMNVYHSVEWNTTIKLNNLSLFYVVFLIIWCFKANPTLVVYISIITYSFLTTINMLVISYTK